MLGCLGLTQISNFIYILAYAKFLICGIHIRPHNNTEQADISFRNFNLSYKKRDERSNLWKCVIIPTSITQKSMPQICQDKYFGQFHTNSLQK